MTNVELFALPGSSIALRRAAFDDIPAIVRLLATDELGAHREDVAGDNLDPYEQAFRSIDADAAHLLLVAADGVNIVATMQLSFIPGLAHKGAVRAQIEAVRIRQDYRSRGVGRAMFDWAIGEARRRKCAMVQLTTDKARRDAHRFYDRLGFISSHEGFKLHL